MVFESVIVDILNKYLKPYVKRLDSSQLNLGVWKGMKYIYRIIFNTYMYLINNTISCNIS